MEILETVYLNLRLQASQKHYLFDNLYLIDDLPIDELLSKPYRNRWIFFYKIAKIRSRIILLIIKEKYTSLPHFECIVKLIKLFTKLNRKLDGYITYYHKHITV